jgi:hypothetical protein
MELTKFAKVIDRENGKDIVIKRFIFRFQKLLADSMERWFRANKKCNCYIKCNESGEILGVNVMHNHDAGSNFCLIRHTTYRK